MRTRLLALAGVSLALAATPAPIAAQAKDTLAVDVRARLLGPAIGAIMGTVRSITRDTVTLDLDGHGRRSVAWSDVGTVQMSVGRRTYAREGALIGLAAIVAASAYATCCKEYQDQKPWAVFAVGMLGALPAMTVGARVGTTLHHDVWRTVTPPGSTTRPGAPRAANAVIGGPVPDSLR